MHIYDLVIRGGTVIDGTGCAPMQADVAIQHGRIVLVGEVADRGREEIDASGKIVTPGFVDVHTHYDGQITWESRLAPSSDHGVTTVVMGNCGVGFAPAKPGQHEMVVRLMEGVEDVPYVVMTAGIPWNWETFPDYLDALEERRADVDFAAQLPHSPLRVYVMGERGASLEPPTEADLQKMRQLTREAIEAGALGVTTSRSLTHRFRSGGLAPSVSTEEVEMLALAAGLKDAGAGVFQIVPDFTLPAKSQFDLYRKLATESGRPLSFTFMQTPQDPGGWRVTLDELDKASQDGLDIRGQVIARPTGGLLGLELSFHPFSLNPAFREIEGFPLEEKVARMRDPAFRDRILAEQPESPNEFFEYVVSEKKMLFKLGDPPNYHPCNDDSVAALARGQGRDPMEVIYDMLLERGGKEILYRPMGNMEGQEHFESAGLNMVGHERTIMALGDGGAHYSLICDAAYPTYFLTYWVRDAPEHRRVTMPKAIRMLSREPAVALGLHDRGLVKAGYKADLNVIDVDRLHLYAPQTCYDLPAGGRRLTQKSDGYDATIVSGEITYRNGMPTGALPGRLQRHARQDVSLAS